MISSLSGVTIPKADQFDLMVERKRKLSSDETKLNSDGDCSPTPHLDTHASGSVGSPVEDTANQLDEPENTSIGVENLFQKLTSHFNPGFPLQSPFQFNSIAPFLASFQSQKDGRGMNSDDSSNHQNLEQQVLGALVNAASSSNLGLDGRAESVGSIDAPSIEPEDLSLREKSRAGDNDDNSTNAASNWSFEEQFQQLYKLSDDPARKPFLDDWLKFMHENGKPVTRIPIMAKQVLDLFELYRLVVQHGGLVEIINKKLWREITKGLNLPSSITSAAFTLRTQYQKYLYDYECARERLSSPSDLQSAIDGNKREGRRNNPTSHSNGSNSTPLHNHTNGVFSYPLIPNAAAAAMASSLFGKHLNPFARQNDDSFGTLGSNSPAFAAAYKDQLAGLEANQRQFELFQRMADVMSQNHNARSGRDSPSSDDSATSSKQPRLNPPSNSAKHSSDQPQNDSSPSRNALGGLDQLLKSSSATHMKLTNNGDKSMVVSIELNGTTYQGVLFAVKQNGTENGDPLVDLFSPSGYES
ncbi:hypothetical protein M3Y95_00732700 [Aphelenchoides besseyi]|nr:hypothetical protein M3Y95_00732700 [Aphelenchoides besseyi]